MRRVVVLAVLTAALVPMTSGEVATAQGESPYRTYVACGWGQNAAPSHVCDRQGRKAAFFLSHDADVQYRVCLKPPQGQQLCASAQSAPEDELRSNRITSAQRGRHTVKWFVGGERVGVWKFRNKNL